MLFGTNPSLSAAQVRDLLRQSSTDINTPGFDQKSGYGLLNVEKLLAAASPAPKPTPTPTPTPAPAGQGWDGNANTFTRVNAGQPHTAAAEISRIRFPLGGADWVVLSRNDNFADSLAGSSLLGRGPLLFVSPTSVADVTRTELGRVLDKGRTVYLLGGPSAISDNVANVIRNDGYTVVRLAGPSRVETAVAVAEETMKVNPGNTRVLLARSSGPDGNPTAGWADSVSAGGYAATKTMPMLLTGSDQLHPAVNAFLDRHGVSRTTLLGGTSALSAAVEQAVPGAERAAGKARDETAVKIAANVWRAPMTGPRRFAVIDLWRPDGWAFGLAAAGLAADGNAPILGVSSSDVPAGTRPAVSTCGTPEVDLLLVGSAGVISDELASKLERFDKQAC